MSQLVAEGASLPAFCKANIRPGLTYGGQPLEMFYGARKVGVIILPHIWSMRPEGSCVELVARHDGDYLEVKLRETLSQRSQLLQVPLAQWDDVTISPEQETVAWHDEEVSLLIRVQPSTQIADSEELESIRTRVERGATLAFRLFASDLGGSGQMAEMVWLGDSANVKVGVKVPPGIPAAGIVMTALLDRVPVGLVEFRVTRAGAEARTRIKTILAQPLAVFFASFAWEDRHKVASRLQRLQLMGKKFFPARIDLKPDEREKRHRFKEIDDSDAVLVFWSDHARKSDPVLAECRYALDKKGQHRVIPVLLDDLSTGEPASGLDSLLEHCLIDSHIMAPMV